MPSKVSIGGANFPASHGDSRDDLGYGRLNPKYHVQKMLGNDSYPYRDEDDDVDDVDTEVDAETYEALWGKMDSPRDYDPGGGHYDTFSYAGSNTTLSGPAHIGENVTPGMVPFPNMYKSRGKSAVGGTKSGTARGEGSTMSPTVDSGNIEGWANPRYRDFFDEESDEEDNYTLEDIGDSLRMEEMLRTAIRNLIQEYV